MYPLFIDVGYSCLLLKQWEQAIPKLQEALKMNRLMYQDKSLQIATAIRWLATAHFKNEEYDKALRYFLDAMEIFATNKSTDVETECALYIAQCHKFLKNFDSASEMFEKVEDLCFRNSFSDDVQLWVHETMGEAFTEGEYLDRRKGLYHLKEAEAILKRIEKTEDDEENLRELQAKIMNLEIA